MKPYQLAIRLLFRDARSGELSILVLALIIAVTSSTAISVFADRLQRTMNSQAADFMAADLVITGPAPLASSWLSKASSLQLKQAQTAEFSSVLIENDTLLLAGIKAVSDAYPLRGFLKTTLADYSDEETIYHGPAVGEAWVEKRVLSALSLELGDMLTVGEKALRITRLITYEPDKRGDLYSLSPRVMMNAAEIKATGVLQPGSHVHYFYQFSGQPEQIKQYNHWAKPLLNPSQRLMDVHEDRPELGSALSRAERYLGLSSIVVILIAGVAIAMATRRYTERHYDATAILRCLGYKQGEILSLYSSQFVTLGISASLIGCLLGWFAQSGLFYLLQNLLPQSVAAPSPLAVIFGFVSGMATLLGFALPPLLRIKRVSPLRVLRRELDPLPNSAWFVYLLALSIIAVLIWRYTLDLKLTATLIGSGILVLGILAALMHGLLLLGKKLLPYLSLSWRFGLQGIVRQKQASVSQVLAFSLTLVAMILSFSVRTDLIDDWQGKLPDNAPNHFVMNIFPEQLSGFKQELTREQVTDSQFYPVVRGRLVAINNTPVQKIVSKDSQGERATHRDLSLTWSAQQPEGTELSAGTWWLQQTANQVSIEKKLADNLHIELGDELTFTIASEQVRATVTNMRQVNWESMKPNFYMIFSPGTLDKYATTYITSFYLPASKKNLLNQLVKLYPGITVLEVDLIIKQIKMILTQLTQAINYLLLFALLAGFTVLFATVYATLDERIYAGTLLRTLGANKALIRRSQIIEFCAIGLISGTLAVIMAELISFILYTRVLHMPYSANFLLWFFVPMISAFFIGLAGCWGVRNVVKHSPMQILREL